VDYKVLLSIIGTVIAIASYVPYIRGIRSGKIKPHPYSWLIWAVLGFIAGFGQLAGGGGIGALIVLVTALINLAIVAVSYKSARENITKGDTISLVFALLAIPLWLITKGPLLSIVLISIIDAVGFWPTIRKAYHKPWDEGLPTFLLSGIKHVISVFAQERLNTVTVLYPASLALLTFTFLGMLVVRRAALPRPKNRR
jgi:hypothetical protein